MKMEMKMETVKLAQHVQDLAKAFGIRLVFDSNLAPDEAMASHHHDGVDVVIARPVTDETSYAVVLHEMGHHLQPMGHLRTEKDIPKPGCHPRDRHRWANLKLEEEQAAWIWARHYALEWTIPMAMVERFAYETYSVAKARTR